jgi:hypothetical protein
VAAVRKPKVVNIWTSNVVAICASAISFSLCGFYSYTYVRKFLHFASGIMLKIQGKNHVSYLMLEILLIILIYINIYALFAVTSN